MKTLFTLALLILPALAGAVDFSGVTFHDCYDGDTCKFTIPGVHPLLGEKIPVRFRGIDTPEIRGKCQAEKDRAVLARDFLRRLLEGAKPSNCAMPRGENFFASGPTCTPTGWTLAG